MYIVRGYISMNNEYADEAAVSKLNTGMIIMFLDNPIVSCARCVLSSISINKILFKVDNKILTNKAA